MRWFALVLLGLSLVGCGDSDEAATSSVLSTTTVPTTTAPTTTAPTTTTAMSDDEAAIRQRYALLLTHFDNGLDVDAAGYDVLHPDFRAEVVERIGTWASEGKSVRGTQPYQINSVAIDGATAELLACRWDQVEVMAADGEVLIPGDPAPLLSTGRWVKEGSEWFLVDRVVSEETCALG